MLWFFKIEGLKGQNQNKPLNSFPGYLFIEICWNFQLWFQMGNILKTGKTLPEKAVQPTVEVSELFAADNSLWEHKR